MTAMATYPEVERRAESLRHESPAVHERESCGGKWTTPPLVRLADGTTARLLKDGEALGAAYCAIANAQRSILLEVYIFRSDDTGRAFAQLLAKRAREGLEVRVIYDSIGSIDTDRSMFRMMCDAGVRLAEFHPWNPFRSQRSWRVFNRDHRKQVIVDDTIGVLGGQNLGDEYGSAVISGNSHREEWRDTGVEFRGPSVRLMREAFARMWNYLNHGGPIHRAQLLQSAQVRPGDRKGDCVEPECTRRWRRSASLGSSPSRLGIAEDSMAIIASAPTPRSRLLLSLRHLLRDARESIDLTMAYFAPPQELLEQLCRSAMRGVRVRLMLPSRSDVAILVVAARAFYEDLMNAGCEIFELQNAVLHAKTLCVDGRLSIVGSTNLDYRSIQYNFELSAVIHSRAFGAHMHEMFEHDMRCAHRFLPDEWRHRPVRDRLVQWLVMRARNLL